MEFQGFPKIPRYSRECIITEKIDGTNAHIYIAENSEPIVLKSGRIVPLLVASRTRYIFPEEDNHGFAKWAYEHTDELLKLGPGRHYGEWWGQGINRGYGLKEKRFSLFNVKKWENNPDLPSCCYIVPIMLRGIFDTSLVSIALSSLKIFGSYAAPGFMKPEGIVIYHVQGNILFKKTIEHDEQSKGVQNESLC